jgi:hypothetical protein
MWLSRITMPSTYVVIYSLSALLPSLPVIGSLRPSAGTALSSVWLIWRAVAFGLLGATMWWHTRPMLLLWSGVVMLAGFLGTTLPALWLTDSLPMAIALMICGQTALGLSMGLIYAASLYFGMVLSEGSTEHGGYHEALVGLGQILGPGAGALTQWIRPDNLLLGVDAVTVVIVFTITAASIAAIRARR